MLPHASVITPRKLYSYLDGVIFTVKGSTDSQPKVGEFAVCSRLNHCLHLTHHNRHMCPFAHWLRTALLSQNQRTNANCSTQPKPWNPKKTSRPQPCVTRPHPTKSNPIKPSTASPPKTCPKPRKSESPSQVLPTIPFPYRSHH